MPNLLHRVSIFDQAVGADGVLSFDLPSNPLSVIMLALRPLNDTGTVTNYQRTMGIASSVLRASVIHNGAAVFSMSGRDIIAYNYFRHGILPPQQGDVGTNNFRRAVIMPILLGRWAYDVSSCLPASARGSLTLELDLDIASTGFDGLRISGESIELLDAKPKYAERKVTLSQTWAATGDNDLQLPGGNLLRGLLLFGTTAFTGASPVPSWGQISLFKDGEQTGYSSTDWEVSTAISSLMGRQVPSENAHVHITDGTNAGADFTSDGFENYSFLDLDPTRDDMFSIDATKVNSFFVRAAAESADAVRCIPIQRLSF